MIPYMLHDRWQKPSICHLWGLDDAAAAAAISGIASTASAGIQAATAGKTNARGSRLAHRQHEWAVQDAKMQHDWAVEDWNRNNEYNSPSAVIERYKAAGLNPMAAVNNGNMTQAAQQNPLGSGVASPSLPNFVNAGPGIGAAIEAAGNSFMQYQNYLLEQKRVKNDTLRANADADYKAALTLTEDRLRDNRVSLGGVTVELAKSQKNLTDEEVKQTAANIVKLQQDVETTKQYAAMLGIQAKFIEFQRYAARKMLPLQVKQVTQALIFGGQQIINLKNINYAANLQNRKDYTYFKTGRWWKDTKNQSDLLEANRKTAQQGVYSDFGAATLRGMNIVSSVLTPAVQAMQGFYIYQRANQIRGQMKFQPSIPNQQPTDLLTPQGNIEFGF